MEDSEEYGPALPPGMIAGGNSSDKSNESRSQVLGPSVPGHLRKSSDSDELSDEGQLMVKMESDMSPEQNDSTVGPIPSEMATEGDSAAKTADEFEKRSKRMKDKLSIKSEPDDLPVKREEWMTDLPPEMGKNFGLQNRQFTKGSGDGGDDNKDRSVWTETPSIKKEKDSKGKKRKREEEKALSARDQKLHQQVEDYNKSSRSESLVDLHSKKQKKKKKKEKKEKKKKKEKGEKEERRPFDRDKDLSIKQIDEAQRKAIIKKSAVLNTRFSFGERTSHFL